MGTAAASITAPAARCSAPACPFGNPTAAPAAPAARRFARAAAATPTRAPDNPPAAPGARCAVRAGPAAVAPAAGYSWIAAGAVTGLARRRSLLRIAGLFEVIGEVHDFGPTIFELA